MSDYGILMLVLLVLGLGFLTLLQFDKSLVDPKKKKKPE